jgi:hypothetical protein
MKDDTVRARHNELGSEKARPDRCQGCAFTEGTEANQSLATQIKAKLCLRLSEPFYCHEADGTDPPTVCRGFIQALGESTRSGLGPLSPQQYQIAAEVLEVIRNPAGKR